MAGSVHSSSDALLDGLAAHTVKVTAGPPSHLSILTAEDKHFASVLQ